MVQVIGSDSVWIQIQAAQVGDPGQPGRVVDDNLVCGSTGRERQFDRAEPVRPRFGGALLEEELALGAIDVALEGHRPAARAPQRAVDHGQVVRDQIALGVARTGEVDLIRVRNGNLPARDLDNLALVCHGRTIPRALSGARPPA